MAVILVLLLCIILQGILMCFALNCVISICKHKVVVMFLTYARVCAINEARNCTMHWLYFVYDV